MRTSRLGFSGGLGARPALRRRPASADHKHLYSHSCAGAALLFVVLALREVPPGGEHVLTRAVVMAQPGPSPLLGFAKHALHIHVTSMAPSNPGVKTTRAFMLFTVHANTSLLVRKLE